MAKRIIVQRRGRGTSTYRSPSHRFIGKPTHRPLDNKEKKGVVHGVVRDIVKCPGHYAPLAFVEYDEINQVGLIIAPRELKVGQKISSGNSAELKTGNTLPLKNIPEGTSIYNLEIQPGDLGKLVRTSGSFARVVTKSKGKIVIKLPSQKRKEFNPECRATIGIIAGAGRGEKPLYKAGRNHHKMKARNKLYPRTSAGAMNATDHPFGSGRGGPTYGGKSSSIAPKNAPPGRKVGMLRPKHTGRNK